MSGKSGKRETAKKPTDVNRTSAKTDGAFGRENGDDLKTEIEGNVDKAVEKKQ